VVLLQAYPLTREKHALLAAKLGSARAPEATGVGAAAEGGAALEPELRAEPSEHASGPPSDRADRAVDETTASTNSSESPAKLGSVRDQQATRGRPLTLPNAAAEDRTDTYTL